MCYEHYHTCQYCKKSFECRLMNKVCPTVNFDVDKNMCDGCKVLLEEFVDAVEFNNALDLLRKLHDGKN